MSEIPRAKQPYGFQVWEVWADALGWEPSAKRDVAFWLYRNAIHGARIMVKFEDFMEQGDWYAEILRRHEVARSLGLKTMLCIDWFNRAEARGGYHSSVVRPPDVPAAVNSILRDFRPDMVEVCNEPYYAKRAVDRITIKEYRDFVRQYADGADRASFGGEFVASQSNKKFWKKHNDHVADGWEWSVWWPHGMVEGKHSAVLHDYTTLEQLIQGVGGGWHNGKPIGYKHPIFETETSICGRRVKDFAQQAYHMAKGFTDWARSVKLPYAYLIMGGGPGNAGGWGLYTRLIDEHANLTKAAEGILDSLGIEYDPSEPPDDPDDDGKTYPGTVEAYKAIKRMEELGTLSAVKRDRKVRRYMKRWHKKWKEN
jgi:hypothetical protein